MNETILVVRSGESYDDTLVSSLECCGFTVLTAEDPLLAIFQLRLGKIDYVVVDSAKPAGEEIGMSTFLTELSNHSSSPPLVLVSESPQAPTFSARWGAAAFVPKPCNANELGPVFARMNVSGPCKSGRSQLKS